MKPARGWAEWWLSDKMAPDPMTVASLESTVRRIQDEALEAAAKEVESQAGDWADDCGDVFEAAAVIIRALKAKP